MIGIAIIVTVVVIIIPLLLLADFIRAIKQRGLFIILLGVLIGRHYSGNHHTNATFWRDSDGTVQGIPRHHIARRYHRAGWKNLCRSILYILVAVLTLYGLALERTLTVVLFSTLVTSLLAVWVIRTYRRLRKWYVDKALVTPLASGLSTLLQMAPADMEKAITMQPGWQNKTSGVLGRIRLSDTFIGDDGEVSVITRYIERRIPKPVEVTWKHTSPPTIIIKADTPFPARITFRDRLSDIQACKPGQYIGGYNKKGEPEVLDHTADMPMKGYCMNTGTGKTCRILVTAAQILGNDPTAELVGFDVKQVSLAPLKGIKGVTIYDDPFEMGEMWQGWYALKHEMDIRYSLKKSGQQKEFPVKWIFLEEGNTFAILIKSFYMNTLRDKGDPAAPPIWSEAIAPILYQGREVGIYVNALLQNFMEKYFGNMSLRPAFSTIGMAGFKSSQYKAIVGETPIPACQKGQGRLLICEPDRQVWVQGLYDEPKYLMQYASQNRGYSDPT